MVGVEGVAIRGVKRVFEREGLATPDGKRIWSHFFIREASHDDERSEEDHRRATLAEEYDSSLVPRNIRLSPERDCSIRLTCPYLPWLG